MKKRMIAVLLALAMLLGITGCGKHTGNDKVVLTVNRWMRIGFIPL